MKTRSLKTLLFVMLLSCVPLFAGADIGRDREAMHKLYAGNNWKEALAKALLNCSTVSDAESAKDLSIAFECMSKLNNYGRFEELMGIVTEQHKANAGVLYHAAMNLAKVPYNGVWVDDAFVRGGNLYSNGRVRGEVANSSEKDRVRALRLFAQSYGLDGQDVKSRVATLKGWSSAVLNHRSQERWKLQVLTRVNDITEVRRGRMKRSFMRGGPVTEDGDPVYYEVPVSYEAAKNDGERWRWLLAQQVELDPSEVVRVKKELAEFLIRDFGVNNLQFLGRRRAFIFNDEVRSDVSELKLYTLKDDETITMMADGVKRLKLPVSQNFIEYYKDNWRLGDAESGDRLVSIYLNRLQYDKAANLLADLLKASGDTKDGARKKRLEQITGNWANFDPVSRAFVMNSESKKVAITYRNAKQVTLRLYKLDVDAVNEANWKYIVSDPKGFDRNKANLTVSLDKYVNGAYRKYVKDEVANKTYALKPKSRHWDTRADLELPELKDAGAYLVKAEVAGGDSVYTLVWVDDMMILSRKVAKGQFFVVADSETGSPIAGVKLLVRGYKQVWSNNERRYHIETKTYEVETDEAGQYFYENTEGNIRSYEWNVVAKKGARRAWHGFNWRYSSNNNYQTSFKADTAYGVTSQPVYKPGDKVLGKFWVRTVRYDLGAESMYAGIKFNVQLYDPKGKKLGQPQEVVADEYGSVAYSIDLLDEAMLGAYSVKIEPVDLKRKRVNGRVHFRVEEYKKPEYEVKVETPSTPVRLGDAFEAVIKAKYYHGAPVTNAKVKVKVLRHVHDSRWFPKGRWDWLYGSGYGWLDTERSWYPGWSQWGCRCPLPSWNRSDLFLISRSYQHRELILEKDYQIGKDGELKVEIDTKSAKLLHGDKNHRYEVKVEVIDASRRSIHSVGSVVVAKRPFEVVPWLDSGYALAGERIRASVVANTLDGREVRGWSRFVLYKIGVNREGDIIEKAIREWDREVFSGEKAVRDFKVDEAGRYRLASFITDDKGREVEGAILFSVRGPAGEYGDVRYDDLEITLDKRTYRPGENVKLLVSTKRENSSVLLFSKNTSFRKFIKINGYSQVVEIPVGKGDMPNFFVEAITISNACVHSQVREVIVPPVKRILNVEVVPSADKYKPEEKGSVRVKVTDENGDPVSGDCALTIYDKSLEYISGGSNVADIRSSFWKWKRHYTQFTWMSSVILSGGNSVKKGEDFMRNLGAFGGDLGLRYGQELLKLKMNNVSALVPKSMGSGGRDGGGGGIDYATKGGDILKNIVSYEGKSLSFAGLKSDHASRGEQIKVRKNFVDLVQWAGSVKLDENGMAEVPVEYPDNLTTWKIKTWVMAHGTRVGEGSAEVITSKDLIIRLQAPRFFIEKDEVVLSAVVHNYHDIAKDAKVSLELEGGTLKLISGERSQAVSLGAKSGERRINWRVKVSGVGEAIIRMKVITDNDSDAMEMNFPVYAHGMMKRMAWSREIEPGQNSTKIIIDVPEERKPEESRLEVRYSPTIAGAIVDALPYLAEYPYGCTEQTLNRFVPTVITQKILKEMGFDLEAVRNKRINLNPQELGDDRGRARQWIKGKDNPVFNEKEVRKMTRAGVQKLLEMQLSDGGWGWFSGLGERSYPHTTAVVVHGLRLAELNGVDIPENSIKRGVAWLKRYEAGETEKIRMWNKRDKHTKQSSGVMDAFVRLVLAENDVLNKEMLDFQYRDKGAMGIYAKSMLGMSLHLDKDIKRRDEVIRNIEQFLKFDDENQTAYLEMGNSGYWWKWYGSEIEAHAFYLKLLSVAKPKSKQARGVVKYLVNNRKHATYWNSTRDTAYCIEAISAYMKASGEDDPVAEVEVLVNGKSYKKVKIDKDNIFSFDNKVTLAGDILTGGKHTVEIRRKGNGALYTNAYLTVFTKEDHIKKTGLEVKVERRFYKLIAKESEEKVAGQGGQVLNQKIDAYERVPMKVGDRLRSGDLIEVELLLESKNDYEYLMFSDFKAAGTEAEKLRSGYVYNGNMSAYMEMRDEKVCFFVRQLPRGKHSLTYRLKAEIPGKFSALPATVAAMYAPELRANSDEMKVEIED